LTLLGGANLDGSRRECVRSCAIVTTIGGIEKLVSPAALPKCASVTVSTASAPENVTINRLSKEYVTGVTVTP
jgi:uncharacterized protein (DUF1810 family)